MGTLLFENPILNSHHDYPKQNWELDETDQPTQKVIAARRQTEFITKKKQAYGIL